MKTKIWYVASKPGIKNRLHDKIYDTPEDAIEKCEFAIENFFRVKGTSFHVYEAEVTGDRLVK